MNFFGIFDSFFKKFPHKALVLSAPLDAEDENISVKLYHLTFVGGESRYEVSTFHPRLEKTSKEVVGKIILNHSLFEKYFRKFSRNIPLQDYAEKDCSALTQMIVDQIRKELICESGNCELYLISMLTNDPYSVLEDPSSS